MEESDGGGRVAAAQSFQHEFLIRLAPIWLACRWRIMGGGLTGRWPKTDLAFDLLGMTDYAAEMRLMCGEAKGDARR